MMDENVEILNHIYKNSKIGYESIRALYPYIKDNSLKGVLLKQKRGYTSLNKKIRQELAKEKKIPKRVCFLTKLMIKNSMKWNVLFDKSASHLTEMMIEGSTMGVIQAIRSLHKAQSVSKEVRRLTEAAVKFEQNNIEQLKAYL